MNYSKLYCLNDFEGNTTNEIFEYLSVNDIKNFSADDIEATCSLIPNFKNKLKGFNISTTIDVYNKEFDLIKIGNDILVNIELKKSYKDLRQCEDNYKIFTFHFPKHNVYVFQYLEKDNSLFLYNHNNSTLENIGFEYADSLIYSIKNPEVFLPKVINDNAYIDANFYLNNKYILNSSQENAKNRIHEFIDNSANNTITVSGRAGTGKSLLALDLYNELSSNYNVKYIVGFTLENIKDKRLIDRLGITTIKEFCKNKEKCDILIVDEAQRISESNYNIFKECTSKKILLFGDMYQNIESEQCFIDLRDNKNKNVDHVIIDYVVRSDDTFDIFARKILNIGYKNLKGKRLKINDIHIKMITDLKIEDLTNSVIIEPAKSVFFEDCTSKCNNQICKRIKQKSAINLVPYTSLGSEYKNVVLFFCNGYSVNNNQIYINKKVCYGNLRAQLYNIITRTTDSLTIVTENIKMYTYLKTKLNEMKKYSK